MQINSCLYHSRGMAEYLLVIDLDEFFVPRGNNWNFFDVLNSIKPTKAVSSTSKKGNQKDSISEAKKNNYSHGWATKHDHPACYIKVFSDVVANPYTGGYSDAEHPWTGQR